MNQQQKKWEKEQKRRLAKKERAAEAAAHPENSSSKEDANASKPRDTSFTASSPVKAARHQAPAKAVHKQGTQRGG